MERFRVASAIGSSVTDLAKARHLLPATATGGGEQSRAEAAGLLVGLQWDLVKVLSFLAWQSEDDYSRLGIWDHVFAVVQRVDETLVVRLNGLMNSTEDLLK